MDVTYRGFTFRGCYVSWMPDAVVLDSSPINNAAAAP